MMVPGIYAITVLDENEEHRGNTIDKSTKMKPKKQRKSRNEYAHESDEELLEEGY